MPHIDELLGVATVAAAGMFAAIAVQPLASLDGSGTSPERTSPVVAAPAAHPGAARVARFPAIDLVARRGVEWPRIAADETFAAPS